jgi:hypothetical protein
VDPKLLRCRDVECVREEDVVNRARHAHVELDTGVVGLGGGLDVPRDGGPGAADLLEVDGGGDDLDRVQGELGALLEDFAVALIRSASAWLCPLLP